MKTLQMVNRLDYQPGGWCWEDEPPNPHPAAPTFFPVSSQNGNLRNFLFGKPFCLPQTSQRLDTTSVKAEGTGNTFQLGPRWVNTSRSPDPQHSPGWDPVVKNMDVQESGLCKSLSLPFLNSLAIIEFPRFPKPPLPCLYNGNDNTFRTLFRTE